MHRDWKCVTLTLQDWLPVVLNTGARRWTHYLWALGVYREITRCAITRIYHMTGNMACDDPRHFEGGWGSGDLVSSQPPQWDPSPLLAAIIVGFVLALIAIHYLQALRIPYA